MEKGPYADWKYIHTEDHHELLSAFLKSGAKCVAFDTETTGLHIIQDLPFLVQIGWNRVVYTFYPTAPMMDTFFRICSSVKWVFGHNVIYDAHMLTNIGYRTQVEKMTNLCDTQAIMRLAVEAKSARDGGDNLKLKDLGVKYIHPYASNSESLIKEDLKRLNDERIKVLTAALKQFPLEGQFTPTGRQKYWGKKAIEDFIKDITNTIDDLPTEIREIWDEWQAEYPEPNYSHIDRELMLQYAGEDVATTLMLAEHGMEVVKKRNQLKILQLERDCLLPKYRMERQGMATRRDYLEESRLKMRDYILRLRKDLQELCGEKVTVNQHVRIKDLFNELFNIMLESGDKTAMLQVRNNFEGKPKQLATLVSKLRTAEKWYSTYIVRVLKHSSYDGRSYTQINLNGAVSGRMSSDFQQFPRDPFFTLEGEELFNPRNAFQVDGGEYPELVFIDYSQIELRSQAHYTLLTTGGDLNLCRAYMPFRCTHKNTGETYDYRTAEQRDRWLERDAEGNSLWLTEDGKAWVPTDLHTMTAMKAYPHVQVDSDEFQEQCRPKGKTTNFASNYGAGPGALVKSLGITWEEAETLINGYNMAFPGVIAYQEKITLRHSQRGYVENHYGRRYYLKNNREAYKLANYVVQGTCADALKKAIIEMDKFLQGKKTKMVLPVHDEQIFSVHVSEKGIENELREIMIKAFDWCLVPVNVGIDTTTTTWGAA